MELTAVLTHADEGEIVALNPETATTTQGATVDEALANLKEATALHLAEFPLSASGYPVVTMSIVPEPTHAWTAACLRGRGAARARTAARAVDLPIDRHAGSSRRETAGRTSANNDRCAPCLMHPAC